MSPTFSDSACTRGGRNTAKSSAPPRIIVAVNSVHACVASSPSEVQVWISVSHRPAVITWRFSDGRCEDGPVGWPAGLRGSGSADLDAFRRPFLWRETLGISSISGLTARDLVEMMRTESAYYNFSDANITPRTRRKSRSVAPTCLPPRSSARWTS